VVAKVLGSPSVTVNASQAITVRTDVYQATLKVKDLLGLPVSGVGVSLTFGNATSTSFTTDGDGVVSLGLLPAGTYQASVSGLGGPTKVSIDPSIETQAVVNVIFSYTVIDIIVVVVLLIVAAVVVVTVRGRRPSHSTPMSP
jgi:hypothetical protein